MAGQNQHDPISHRQVDSTSQLTDVIGRTDGKNGTVQASVARTDHVEPVAATDMTPIFAGGGVNFANKCMMSVGVNCSHSSNNLPNSSRPRLTNHSFQPNSKTFTLRAI